MIRTYLDTGVIIDAFSGKSDKALEILDDPNRTFIISDYLKLELLPKPMYHQNENELQFINEIFNHAECCISNAQKISDKALEYACKYGLSALDALHIATALLNDIDEIITTEKDTKPMFRLNTTEEKTRIISIA